MASPKKSTHMDNIAKHASTRGVTVFLDGDDTSSAFMQGLKYEFKDKRLTLVLSKFSEVELLKIEAIVKEYLDVHGLVLDEEQEEILENYQGYTDENPYLDAINLFTGKISVNDLNALKMSFFMKIQKEHGEEIDNYKQQIRDRFGARGLYISNLCYAGYFENDFRRAALKLDGAKFLEYYGLKVGLELAALFVHSGMTMSTLKQVFEEKVNLCEQKSINRFRVHCFGRQNIELIKEFFHIYDDHAWSVDIKKYVLLDSPTALEYDIIIS